MCEYCVDDKRKKREFIYNSPILSERIINNDELFAFEILSINREDKIVKSYKIINYCPMCRERVERS